MTRFGAALAISAVLGLSASITAADDPKLPDTKVFDKLVIDTLRDVHNKGADLYNTSRDFSGAYRLYQGALETVRPLLAHRPEAQKIIDSGLATADKETDVTRKAFLLHETIENVRKYLKGAISTKKPEDKKPEDKKPEDKKPIDKKPEDKKPEDKKPMDVKPADKKPEDKKPIDKKPEDKKPNPAPSTAAVSGKVTLAGKPLATGEVTLVSLNLAAARVFTAKVNADGTFKFADAIPPGRYTAIVTGDGVPAKYSLANTSGLMLEFAAGENTTDLVLK